MWKWTYDLAATCINENHIVVAFPFGDTLMRDSCELHNVNAIGGPGEDVLMRYILCAGAFDGERTIMRLTADCPFIPQHILKTCIDSAKQHSPSMPTLVTTAHPLRRTYPDGWDIEIFSHKALLMAHNEATSAYDREHVTSYMYNHPESFCIEELDLPIDMSHIKCSIDTKEDLDKWVKK
jgi:spore coat polysaccharide biosynthesis protein SpsF